MLLLHISDTHLGSSRPFTRLGLLERERDYYDVFDEAVDIAIGERVEAVIHSGDLFDDPRPPPRPYIYAARSLRKLAEHGVKFIAVAGQHDQPKRRGVSPLSVLSEMGLIYSFGEAPGDVRSGLVKLRSCDLGVTGIPYFDKPQAGSVVGAIKPPDSLKKVLVAHALIQELGLSNYSVSISQLPVESYDYVALGDYHLFYRYEKSSIPAVYPGSTEALDVREYRDERYVVLVDLSKEAAVFQKIKLERVRKFIEVNVSGYSELLVELSKLSKVSFPKKPALYINLTRDLDSSELSRVRSEVRKLIERGAILSCNIIPRERELTEVREEHREVGFSLNRIVEEFFKNPRVIQLVQSLLNSSREGDVETIVNLLTQDRALLSELEKLVKAK
ncbi:MAG: exonuclease SbcCD subunit D [Desulfurococcaceae archaeon]|nr:exonuclease SbcCD subunit D [Sulfolobales archaeon]MDW8170665.1 exonuclease SbcCD subunit D [Desulfurococcaceae archaeon]